MTRDDKPWQLEEWHGEWVLLIDQGPFGTEDEAMVVVGQLRAQAFLDCRTFRYRLTYTKESS